MQMHIDIGKSKQVVDEVMKITSGPGEAAMLCLCLFMLFWEQTEPAPSRQQTADDARTILMSTDYEPEGSRLQ
jgi:hypothetical protein